MNYEKAYSELIENRKNRELDPNEYYERHHIWPKSLAIDDEEEKLLNQDWNLVYLTYREHFIAHHLLYKICEGNDKVKMANAWHYMCYGNNEQNKRFTDRQYERARKAMSEAHKGKELTKETKQKLSEANKGKPLSEESKQKLSEAKQGKNNPLYGKKLAEQTKQKMSEVHKGKTLSGKTKLNISEAHKGKELTEETKQKLSEVNKGKNHPFYGKNHTEESKQKMSEVKQGKLPSKETKQKMSESHKGKTPSEETRQKMSKSRKGKKQEIIKCPHCGKEGGKSMMKRYHFDNCKYKKDDGSVTELFFKE